MDLPNVAHIAEDQQFKASYDEKLVLLVEVSLLKNISVTNQSGVTILMSGDELSKFFSFTYCESILIPQQFVAQYGQNVGMPANKIIEEMSQNIPRDKLEIRFIDKEVGFGVFTKELIKKGTVICLYAGKISNRTGNPEYQLSATDASKFGGIARFIQHLPNDTDINNSRISTMEQGQRAGANLSCCVKFISGISINYLKANRDIQSGEQIGYSYNSMYWANKGVPIRYFDMSGKLIPFEKYLSIPLEQILQDCEVLDKTQSYKEIALLKAIGKKKLEQVQCLLEYGARIDFQDDEQNHKKTALHCAAIVGDTEIIKLLISRGASTYILDAKNNIALQYNTPIMLPRYEENANKGNMVTQDHLGRAFLNGVGVNKNDELAQKWFQKAADNGYPPSQNSLGLLYLEKARKTNNYKEYELAKSWFEKAVIQGNECAQCNLGLMYLEGYIEGTPDYTKAKEWFEKAAIQNNDCAQDNLGLMYLKGYIGRTPDYIKAKEWFEKAAIQGDEYAQCYLGGMYYQGKIGERQDYVKAKEWFEKAAEQGVDLAQNNLGCLYRDGHGIPQDYTQAQAWFEKAAVKGNAGAQFNLGLMYLEGYIGKTPDYMKAQAWFKKAAEQEHTKAKETYKTLEQVQQILKRYDTSDIGLAFRNVAKSGTVNELSLLLQTNPTIINSAGTISKKTALHVATEAKKEDNIRFLLEHGADQTMLDASNKTASNYHARDEDKKVKIKLR